MKKFILLVSLVMGASAIAGDASYHLYPGEVATNYGQINRRVYLDYHSVLFNYGQINADIICDHCKFINYGQHNGRLIKR